MNAQELKEAAVAYGEAEYQSPYAALADELYRERVLRARNASPESKILAGQRLFESACEITLLGIRHDFPGLTEDQCRVILRERLVLRRKLEAQENDG